jgi:hypothetical protein
MIRTLFEQTRPLYVQYRNRRLLLRGREYETLDATIRDMVPVRKLFEGSKLSCWSINGAPGRDKRLCAFCPDAARCQKRLRLNLIVRDDNGTEIPAVLEVRASAFDALDSVLEGDGTAGETWRETLFRIRVTVNPRGFEDIVLDRIF